MHDNNETNESHNESQSKNGVFFEKWYEDDFILAGWFILFFPIGLYGVWIRNNFGQKKKYLFAIFSFLGIVFVSRSKLYFPVYFIVLPVYLWVLMNKKIYSRSLKSCFLIPTIVVLILGALSQIKIML